MRVLLDEYFPQPLPEQLRQRGHDVVAVHDLKHGHLEGARHERTRGMSAATLFGPKSP